MRVSEQQLNQSKSPFVNKNLSDIQLPQCLKPINFMHVKVKNLRHKKLTEQCTRPSRMPGRNNMSRYDSFQLPTPPSPAKSNNRKRLIKRLRWRYEEKTYTFFSTRYKDNYEPLIANVEFCVVPHRRVQRTHRIQPDVKSVCCGRPPSQPF